MFSVKGQLWVVGFPCLVHLEFGSCRSPAPCLIQSCVQTEAPASMGRGRGWGGREGFMLHSRARNKNFLCHLPHIPSLLGAIKTGSKEHMEPRHLKVILNKLGPQIKTCSRRQELSFWGPCQLHVPSGDAVPMSSLTGTSGSAKAESG